MLMHKATALVSSPDWTYEPKWDGFRVIAMLRDGGVRLVSRNGHSFTTSSGRCRTHSIDAAPLGPLHLWHRSSRKGRSPSQSQNALRRSVEGLNANRRGHRGPAATRYIKALDPPDEQIIRPHFLCQLGQTIEVDQIGEHLPILAAARAGCSNGAGGAGRAPRCSKVRRAFCGSCTGMDVLPCAS
jgi:hypothetical protein